MAFLASLKKNIEQFKVVEEHDPIYVPFAELLKKNENDADSKEQEKSEISQVKIACISDIHMRLKELKMVKADILILSGDFTNKGTIKEAKEVNLWLGEMKKQFEYKHIIAIAGNHEGYGDLLICKELLEIENGETTILIDPTKSKDLVQKQEQIRIQKMNEMRDNIMTNVDTFLYDNEATIFGIKFYGSPWTSNLIDPQDRGNKKHFDRGLHGNVFVQRMHWDQIPLDVDYLITHGPPQGILDINGKGCSMLRLKLGQLKRLRVHQFGHVHSGYGYAFIDKQSLSESVKHIDQSQIDKLQMQFLKKSVDDAKNDDGGDGGSGDKDYEAYPVKLDKDTKLGKTLKKYGKKEMDGVNVMEDVCLFINAATDGYEQPIHFNFPYKKRE